MRKQASDATTARHRCARSSAAKKGAGDFSPAPLRRNPPSAPPRQSGHLTHSFSGGFLQGRESTRLEVPIPLNGKTQLTPRARKFGQ
jgi:hypothetical protein